MKGKDLHPRLLYPAKLSFRMEGKIKCFPGKVRVKEFIITKPLLYEMLKKSKENKIKIMNSKITTNSQLSTTEPKKQKQMKQTRTPGKESQKWRSHGGLSAWRWRADNGGKGTGNKKHKWYVQNRGMLRIV